LEINSKVLEEHATSIFLFRFSRWKGGKEIDNKGVKKAKEKAGRQKGKKKFSLLYY
jgi:hypothetical protein